MAEAPAAETMRDAPRSRHRRIARSRTSVLVAIEIVILFVGILARYVFHRPLVWSDELASILFLWLAVLGSALAFRRGENLRMTTLREQAVRCRRSVSSSRSRWPPASPSW